MGRPATTCPHCGHLARAHPIKVQAYNKDTGAEYTMKCTGGIELLSKKFQMVVTGLYAYGPIYLTDLQYLLQNGREMEVISKATIYKARFLLGEMGIIECVDKKYQLTEAGKQLYEDWLKAERK